MLTIAGSGVSCYSLKELSDRVNWSEYDSIITDINFNNDQNNKLLPVNIEKHFVLYGETKDLIKEKLIQKRNILYIVSGSPLYFSASKSLIDYLTQEIVGFKVEDVTLINAESSKSYFLSKLKIPEDEVISLSLHGKDSYRLDLSRFLLNKYTFILCDENTIESIYQDTKYLNGDLTFYLGSKLGSKEEIIIETTIDHLKVQYTKEDIKHKLMPYVLLVKRNYEFPEFQTSDEELQTHLGLMTKIDKRYLTLQALKLSPNLILWDIGAGSGAISIDAYKLFKVRTVLFEKNDDQCLFIENNLIKHKIAGATLLKGDAFLNLTSAQAPDRIFIGGGGINLLSKLEELYSYLKSEGIIVVNIIGLESLSCLIDQFSKRYYNYKIRSINIDNYKQITNNPEITISNPERTLFQLIITKD